MPRAADPATATAPEPVAAEAADDAGSGAPEASPAAVTPQRHPAPSTGNQEQVPAPEQEPAPAEPVEAPTLTETVTPAERPETAPADPSEVTASDQYVIAPGDTLSEIAERYNIEGGWQALYEMNRDVIEDPDLIYPGEIIILNLS